MDKQDELAAAILNAVDADGDMVLYAGTFYTREATAAIIAAAVRSFMGSERPGHEGFSPCPTCKQYSHSLGDDALAKAYMHFEMMTAHPVRGHPMGHVYDDATRDAAQVLMAAARDKEGANGQRD